MKLLFIVDNYRGGAGNVIQILAKNFSEEGNKVTIMLTNKNSQPRYVFNDNISEIDFKLSKMTSGNKFFTLLNWICSIRKKIINENPEIVISFLTEINAMVGIALIGTKIPLVVSERLNPIYAHVGFAFRFLRFFSYYRANKIVVQTSDVIDFCNGRYKNNTIVIPNPINKPDKYKKSTFLSCNIELITLGRLVPQKRFNVLIDAFNIVKKELSNIYLKIYGEGIERENLQKQIDALKLNDCVFLKGHTSDVYESLANSDIYVLSSEMEGFPNALSEAMAVGLPVIAFDCPSGPRDLISNGENGLLVENQNTQELAKAIYKLLTNSELREYISKNAMLVKEKYSSQKIYDLWKVCIKSLIS